MRFATMILVALVAVPAFVQAPTDSALAATNCGFLTIEQCRATASGMGGFCVINQFYNPQRSVKGARKRHEAREVRTYEMPYDPYPWCAQYMDGDK
jgi:hypothetical protein